MQNKFTFNVELEDTTLYPQLAGTKQAMQKFEMKRLNLKKLNEVEGKEEYHVKIPNRLPAFENSFLAVPSF
jgi:hypothetical protein